MTYDLIVRGGTIVDGTGRAPFRGDVAVRDGRIAAVGAPGEIAGEAAREVDATGLVVTPGFVDVHTHYDAQVTWDPYLTPSCFHGVTTAVLGNCGVGFAPARPDEREWLIELMECVEDIPRAAISAGMKWDWESFPEYLDALERAPLAMDIATHVPHTSLRTYVMGERGASNEPATPADIAEMARLVKEGIAAGALGFSTSRTLAHRAPNGEPVPGTFASEDELFGIGRVLGELGTGIFEVANNGAAGEDVEAPKAEVDWMRRLSKEIGRPVSFTMLQVDAAPNLWRELLATAKAARAEGADLHPQIAGRPFGMLMGLQTERHAWRGRPAFEEIAGLPLAELAAELRTPERRRRILSEPADTNGFGAVWVQYDKLFPLGNPMNYEPSDEDSIAAIAKRSGRDPQEVLYDAMIAEDGRAMLLVPALNYSERSCDPIYEMMHEPQTVLGLGDGGAHCALICDASIQTFMLTHWVRDRSRGPRLPIEFAVKRMTHDPARLYGLEDRGTLEPGMKADLNLIDLERLALELPEAVADLPAGARRLVQRARGYVATFVSGVETMRDDRPTGALPGALVRGAQPAPSAA
ncbi:MAG: amidohydrolase family protein [Myxococcota bacterium]|nr:amidohydrolase family protein [Myxococcales bacterium]